MYDLLTYFVNKTPWNAHMALRDFFKNLDVDLIYWISIGTTLAFSLLFYLLISRKVSLANRLVWFLLLVANGIVVGVISVSILYNALHAQVRQYNVGGWPERLSEIMLSIGLRSFTVSFTAQLVIFSMLLFLILSIAFKALSSNARYVPFRWPN